MIDYAALRDLMSHRLTFELDSGARIVGYLGATRPARGPVQLVRLAAVRLEGADGGLIATHDELSLVPNLLVSVERDAATGATTFAYDSGATVTGVVAGDAAGRAELPTLEGAIIRDAGGRILERHDRLVVAARPLTGCRVTEGPGGF